MTTYNTILYQPTCLPTYLPINLLISPEEVRREAKLRSENIYASYSLLHAILLRHELTIQKRWTKNSRHQRLKVLLDHWPCMSSTHRPDYLAFRKTNTRDGEASVSGNKFKDQYMWPHINQEDLVMPKTLLLLLNARGRNPPAAFAGDDFASMYLGFASMSLIPVHLDEHVMLLHGARNAEEYGTLILWEDHPDAFDWMHTQRQFSPGEGLLVLEAQERLLAFLVNCCKQILSDIPPEDLTASKFMTQPEPRLKTEQQSSGFDSLVVMVTEAPYRPPSQLDLTRIVRVLGCRLGAAEDHLWALREDPAYFAEQLIEEKEHRRELINDEKGDPEPVLKAKNQNRFWARVCSTLAVDAYLSLELFAELHRQAQALQRLHRKHAANIIPTESLPEEFLSALLRFRLYLYRAIKMSLGVFQYCVAASAPFRSYFVRQPPKPATATQCTPFDLEEDEQTIDLSVDAPATQIDVRAREGIKLSGNELNILSFFKVLCEDNKNLLLLGLPLVLDQLGNFLETNRPANDLLSAKVAGIISDLAIISRCIAQIESYHPWARGFESALADREQGLTQSFAQDTIHWAKLEAALHEKNFSQISVHGNPSDQKFAYPIKKHRTEQSVDALRKAEKNLDSFWEAVDRLIHAKCKHLMEFSARQLVLNQANRIRRTPEWVKPAPSATKCEKKAIVHTDVEMLSKPFSVIFIDEPKGASSSKRHRETQHSTASSADPTPQASISIPVDGRALKVFRVLFFNPAVTSSPGEISWNDFLHAMTSTGLFSAEKLYGSAWQFQRVKGDQSRIQFHEPYPRGKIPFTMARHYGRRLTKNFGWDGDSFYLKEK
ncbi:hypothetical protein F4678DRAFT_482080 [Xylaria arbuscula]|nr:hypothetical protein F4678DRAFT_482080 [Xylaria arbuscula]